MEEKPEIADSVFSLLANIRKRPAMYLGKPSIHHLRCFLDGWFHRNYDGVSDGELFGEFATWVERKYKVTSTQGWTKVIEFWSADEVKALEHFYELLDEFQIIKARRNKNKPS